MKRVLSPIAIAMLSASLVGSLGAQAQAVKAVKTATVVSPSKTLISRKDTALTPGGSHHGSGHRDLATLIAMAGLAQDKVISPTAEQVSTAVSNVEFLRASGMGWGAIAQTLGVQLGSVLGEGREARGSRDRERERERHDEGHASRPRSDRVTSLAMASLASQSVSNPTPDQVVAAVANIQSMRDSGMGWGAIANALGLRHGDVVSASREGKERTERQAGQTRERDRDREQRSEKPAAAVVATSSGSSEGTGARSERRSEGRGDDRASSESRSSGRDSGGQGSSSGSSTANAGSSSGGRSESGRSEGSRNESSGRSESSRSEGSRSEGGGRGEGGGKDGKR